MRAVVMAALHFDFENALLLGAQSETVFPFNEDPTNTKIFMNVLT